MAETVSALTAIFKRSAAAANIKSREDLQQREEADFAAEKERLAASLAKASSTSASAPAAGSLAPAIPSLYVARTNPDFAEVTARLKSAARTRELAVRFDILNYWGPEALDQLHKIISATTGADSDKLTFSDFNRVVMKLGKWRRTHEQELDESVAQAAKEVGVQVPQLDAEIFLASTRDQSGDVEAVGVMQAMAKQVALFKTEAELLLMDSDDSGYLREEELETYILDLIPSVPTLAGLEEGFHPFYCCGALRHIMWVLDPTGRGRVKIQDLLRSDELSEWLDVQLKPTELPRNWFSRSISSQLYEKFLGLDERGEGMLRLKDMMRYKQGIPPVNEDGLPPDVSPISELFIERVFETTRLYNGEMDYKKFVDFVVAVEFLPACPRPLFFWRIFDLHEEGAITPMILNYFFRQTHKKLCDAGVNPPPMQLILQELFDIIPTAEPLRITKEEFVNAPQCGLLSALVINCLAFWTYENREAK